MMPGSKEKSLPKKELIELQSFAEFLPTPEETAASSSAPTHRMTAFTRKTNAQKEIAQFSSVLTHPAFQANPLAALREHLNNSQEARAKEEEAMLKISGSKKNRNKNKNKKKKLNMGGSLTGASKAGAVWKGEAIAGKKTRRKRGRRQAGGMAE